VCVCVCVCVCVRVCVCVCDRLVFVYVLVPERPLFILTYCVSCAPQSGRFKAKKNTNHISLHIHTAPDPNQVCSGSPNTLSAISTSWSRGWGPVDVHYTWSDLRRPFTCPWTLNLLYP
jgi:hypothetical protein